MEIFEDSVWQMALGERAALEGLLSQLKPDLAIEIGTAQGASLRRICTHAREVHSFDLVEPSLDLPDNAILHTGDSHQLLPEFLAQLASEGRNVDFALVDGDHSPDGARRDVEDLLNSDAVGRSYIVMHDSSNPDVRAGLDGVRYASWPKVASVDLDWITGLVFREPRVQNHLWGGLGLVVVDNTRGAYGTAVMPDHLYPNGHMLAEALQIQLAHEADESARANGELGTLRERLAALEQQVAAAEQNANAERRARQTVEGSFSWRVTSPLRRAKSRARRIVS